MFHRVSLAGAVAVLAPVFFPTSLPRGPFFFSFSLSPPPPGIEQWGGIHNTQNLLGTERNWTQTFGKRRSIYSGKFPGCSSSKEEEWGVNDRRLYKHQFVTLFQDSQRTAKDPSSILGGRRLYQNNIPTAGQTATRAILSRSPRLSSEGREERL